MGWSELQRIPNEYNDKFKELDENLLKIFNERKEKANGKRYFPPIELMQEWAEQYKIDLPEISWLLHSVNHGLHSFTPDGPGDLFSVIPIMKKSILDRFEYVLTHAMQHQNASIIYLEIKQQTSDEHSGLIRPHLLLEVEGQCNFHVNRHGSHGSDGQAQMQFIIYPRLPDNLEEIAFRLIPYAIPMENRSEEVILDKEVLF